MKLSKTKNKGIGAQW